MKITRYLMMLAAFVGMASACQKEEFVVFHPEDVVAPVLHEIEDITINEENLNSGSYKFTWDAADFGIKTQIYYTLTATGANGVTSKIFSNVSGTSAIVSYKNINGNFLYDFEIPVGEAGEVTYTLSAKLATSDSWASNSVQAKGTPTPDEKMYPEIFVIGDYCGWDFAKSLNLFDFAEEDKFYHGVIDFGEKVANGFKVTGVAAWDDSCNWGLKDKLSAAPEKEPESVTLFNGGGSQDIKNFSKSRFYHFTFEKETLILTKNMSFNTVSIIGLNGDWNNDIEMQYSPANQKFYADVEVASDTEFKFRFNNAWDVNLGGALDEPLTENGANIALAAGKYRIYLNLNNPAERVASADARMYGKEEGAGGSTPGGDDSTGGGETEPVENVGWGIVGTINNWGGDGADVDMKVGAGWLVAAGVEIPEGAEIKFRLDGGWDVNFGGTFAAGAQVALEAGGSNFKPAAGTYDIYLNPDLPAAWFVTAGGAAPAAPQTWGIVGTTNNWGADDLDMGMKQEGAYWVRKNTALPAGGQVKFRFAHGWDVNFGGTFAVDAAISLASGGDNMQTVEGTYDIYLDAENAKAFIMTPGKTPADAGEAQVTYIDPAAESFNVGFSGGVLGWDDPAFNTNDRATYVSGNVTDAAKHAGTYEFKMDSLALGASEEFKIRINGEWIGVSGAAIEGITVTGSDNFIGPATAGSYKVKITFAWNGLKPSDVKAVFTAL